MARITVTESDCVTFPVKGGHAFAIVSNITNNDKTDSVSADLLYPNGSVNRVNDLPEGLRVISAEEYSTAIAELQEKLQASLTKANHKKGNKMELDQIKAELDKVTKEAQANKAQADEAIATARKSYEALEAALAASKKETEAALASVAEKDSALAAMKKAECGRTRMAKMKGCKADDVYGKTEDEVSATLAELSDEAFNAVYKMAEASFTKMSKLTENYETSMKKTTEQTQSNFTATTKASDTEADAKAKADAEAAEVAAAAKTALDNAANQAKADLDTAAAAVKSLDNTKEALSAFASSILSKKNGKKDKDKA